LLKSINHQIVCPCIQKEKSFSTISK